MRTTEVFRTRGRDAFVLILDSRKQQDGSYTHDLISNLPDDCLHFAHKTFYVRLTRDYLPNHQEASHMLQKLGNKILEHPQFSPFYFPDFLLVNNSIIELSIRTLLQFQIKTSVKPGNHYSSNTNCFAFYTLSMEFFRFKLFRNRQFTEQLESISRTRFENLLKSERAILDYIELWNSNNCFYRLWQDGTSFNFLCRQDYTPEMIFIH